MLTVNTGKDLGLLILRLGVGLLMLFPHGYSKVVNFSASFDSFPNPLGLGSGVSIVGAVFAEVICSILIMLGIKTRIFATIPLFTMIVAAFIVHANDPWNVKEKAILFGLMYIVLIFTGGGKYSVRD